MNCSNLLHTAKHETKPKRSLLIPENENLTVLRKQSFYLTLNLIPLTTIVLFADTFHGSMLKNIRNLPLEGNNTENSLFNYWFCILIIGFPFKQLLCGFEVDMTQHFGKYKGKLPLHGPHENTLSISYRYLTKVKNVPYF